jgi:biotin carboxyl carrier protein
LSEAKTIRVSWNGEWRDVPLAKCEVRELSSGHFLVTHANQQFEIFASPDGRLSDSQALDSAEIIVESEREKLIRERFQGGALKGTVQTGSYVIKAPMPGLVRAVRVTAGDLVERTSTLLVLEAMKMENNILAGAAGRVERVMVEEGNSVEKNARLVEIVLT